MERSYLSFLLFSLLTTLARAQQGVLTDGNSQLPECAVSCPLLIQAAQACSATDVASQSAWICFCQSAYLTTLKTSAVGICDSVCTDTTQNAQVSTWYNSNCGDDFGASEHADDAGAQPTATAAGNGDNGADATQTAGSKPTKTAGSSAANSQSGAGGSQDGQCHGTWWDCHFQWIIMVLVLAICLPLLGWAGHWLKRRYERKADKPSSGFNAGITDRAPPMSNANFNASGAVVGPSAVESSGRPGSPARTRDAFMPYGYGYAHSDSRLPSQQDRRSPLARGETPGGDAEKDVGMGAYDSPPKQKKRVLVREKSGSSSERWM